MISERLGFAELLNAEPVVAGSYGTWTIRYTAGSYGIDAGGQIKIAFPMVTDWEVPQLEHPTASGYTTVQTDGAAKINASWQPRGYIRPWRKCLVLDVYDGSLEPDNTITVVFGNTAHGSPGMRVQSYQESKFEFRVVVDPTNSANPRPLPTSPQLTVLPDKIASLVCLLPSQALVGDPVQIVIQGEDRWRNPTLAPDALSIEWVGEANVTLDGGRLTAQTVGAGYVVVSAQGMQCRSNPINFYSEAPTLNRYWGDLHAQTKTTVGTGSEDEYFTFARDTAWLDFTSHQGNDFQISDSYWRHINDTTRRFNEEGRFVVFPGYEWSGNTPAGGDLNVFYRHEGQPVLRSSHWLIPEVEEDELTPAHPASVLFEKMKQAVSLNDVLLCAHVGGRYANIRQYFDQELFSLVELVSCWGVFEWLLWDAFEKEYIVGVMCNSDGHRGRPGAESAGFSEFGIANGLTCVLADSLTRDTIFDALKARRCYGTTGARMLLDFTANNQPMGSLITERHQQRVSVQASVTGTGPLEVLQLFRGRQIIEEIRPTAFDDITESRHVRVSWRGSRERGRQRQVIWDGEIRVEGVKITSADTFSFDGVQDGITDQSEHFIRFRSRTTGDRDGIDLWLTSSSDGQLVFDSAAGSCTVNLEALTTAQPRQVFDFGGVDMQVVVERYPEEVDATSLSLTHESSLPSNTLTPFFVKAIQTDGHMAWSSPIYFDTRA